MKSISLTEFNQNPSRATRLADTDQVVVLRRGVAAYRLERIGAETGDPVEALVRTGLLSPAKRQGPPPGRLRVAHTSVDLGTALDADRRRLND